MDEESVAALTVIGCCMILIAIAGFFGGDIGYDMAEKSMKSEAIEAGVAEWRIDAKTGEKSFHWMKEEE